MTLLYFLTIFNRLCCLWLYFHKKMLSGVYGLDLVLYKTLILFRENNLWHAKAVE